MPRLRFSFNVSTAVRLVSPILAYHSVHPDRQDVINVSPLRFAQHMQWLADHGYRGVSLRQYREAHSRRQPSASRMVAITFDDGYLDNFTEAWPILQKHHFTATIFVIPGRVGTQIIHDEQWLSQFPSVPREAYAYMDWHHILSLMDAGIEIGSHTMTHPLLDEIAPEEQSREIHEAKHVLESHLGRSVESFCYPAGHFSDATLRFVREAGYRQAVVTPYKAGQIRGGEFTLKRAGLYRDDTLPRFLFKISPLFDLFRAMRHAA